MTRSSGVVSSVVLYDRDGAAVRCAGFCSTSWTPVGARILLSAYGFDLKTLFEFLDEAGTAW